MESKINLSYVVCTVNCQAFLPTYKTDNNLGNLDLSTYCYKTIKRDTK